MKITICHPNATVALGITPAVETFTLTVAELRVWNCRHYRYGGISANENWNEAQGLPCPAARRFLKKVHESVYGICSPSSPLSMADVRRALS
jgi:hypothetical protein